MKGKKQDMLVPRELQQLQTKQRSVAEIERILPLSSHRLLHFLVLLRIIKSSQVQQRQRCCQIGQNDLSRLAINFNKMCAQAFMARNHFIDRRFHGCGIQISTQAQCFRYMEVSAALKLVEKPKALLGSRSRRVLWPLVKYR